MKVETEGAEKPDKRGLILKPLATTTYLFRNASKTIPLISVIILAVMLVAGIVSMMNSIPYSIRTIYSYSKYSLGISPRGDPNLTKEILDKVKTESPIEPDRIIICRASGSQVNSIVGKWPFVMLGMTEEDTKYYLDKLGTRNIEGRLPYQGEPEAVISKPVATNLKLKVGSIVQSPETQESYSPKEVKVVGIADTDEWLMVNNYSYQAFNHFPPIDNVMVIAKNLEDQRKIDEWAMKEFKGGRAQVFAYHILDEQTDEMFNILYKVLNVVIATLVLVITVMMAMLMNIYQSQRIVEYGLLQALGYTKKHLLLRTMRETVVVLFAGWVLGIGLAYTFLTVVKRTLMDPNAYALETTGRLPYLYTIPIPVTILIVAAITIVARFRKFDPVSVVERRLV